MMGPTVGVMLFWLFAAICFVRAADPDRAQAVDRSGAGAAAAAGAVGLLFVGFVIALDRHWLLAGLGVVFGAFLLLRPRVLLGSTGRCSRSSR